ncbi:TonB-dependent siderophore receptor [Burkholderia multivorans]|uniref:TonB-dependent siderophore receptor n=1 Tax=Burkholderia multivorans TaxID=87883 RepID=UPI0021BE775A|nr:TonB-dependent receptor [Burkholderia multivorans]
MIAGCRPGSFCVSFASLLDGLATRVSRPAPVMVRRGRSSMTKAGTGSRISTLTCVAAALWALSSSPLHAQSAIDLPAQPLSSALVRLAGSMGVNILAPDQLVAGRQAPAVSGQLTLRDALDRLLAGSGLKAVARDEKTYVIEASSAASQAAQPTAADSMLPAIDVNATAIADEPGFVSEFSSAATRTDTPIALMPQSIQVLNRKLLESQGAQSVSGALAYLGGVTTSNFGGVQSQATIRGFNAPITVNGLPTALGLSSQVAGALSIPIDGIEKVEVLRGAESILAGSMDPGGIVNVVTKQPTEKVVRELTTQVGSFGNWKQAIDLGGPLGGDKRLTYRFVLSAERTGESAYGYDGAKSLYVAPSLSWKSAGTSIVIGYRHHVQDVPLNATTLFGPDGAPAKAAMPTAQPGSTLVQSDDVDIDFRHRFNEIFSIESRTAYSRYIEKFSNTGYWPATFASSPGTAYFNALAGDHRAFNVLTDNHLNARFSTGPVKHVVVAGFQYSVNWESSHLPADGEGLLIAPFPSPALPPYRGALVYSAANKNYFSNTYLQDQLSWGRLHVTASVAYAKSQTPGATSQHAWLPNLGVLYELTDTLSVYASSMRSFYPRHGYTLITGGTPPPYSGHSVEAGVKLNLLDDRLALTADVFRSDSATVVQQIPGTGLVDLQGGQVTRGVEASAIGRLLPGLNLHASYAYNAVQSGPGLPRHAGSMWLTYDLQGDRLKGWGGGIGVLARTETFVAADGNNRLPGQAQTDLGIWYRAKHWSATLSVKNVFDRALYQSGATDSQAFLQPGRLIYLTARRDI